MTSLISRDSPGRRALYAVLLSHPGRVWTVAELTAKITRRPGASADTIRATLYQLVDCGVVRAGSSRHSMTFALTVPGRDKLCSIVDSWR
jgi:Fe2+ or Zn2+ uptake regulation protein